MEAAEADVDPTGAQENGSTAAADPEEGMIDDPLDRLD